MNLVQQAATDKTITEVVRIDRFFRSHYIPHATLKTRGGIEPQLPNDTQWNSRFAAIASFIKNRNIYYDIVRDSTYTIDTNVRESLESNNIYNDTLDINKQLEIIGPALDKMQCDTTSLSKVYEVWLKLTKTQKKSVRLLMQFIDDLRKQCHHNKILNEENVKRKTR